MKLNFFSSHTLVPPNETPATGAALCRPIGMFEPTPNSKADGLWPSEGKTRREVQLGLAHIARTNTQCWGSMDCH